MTEAVPLLDVADLTVEFSTRRGIVRAVEHVDVRIAKGETVGIVGESGCGKSTTARLLMHLMKRDAGDIVYDGPLIEQTYHSDAADYHASMVRLYDLPVRVVHGGHFASYDGARHRKIIGDWLRTKEG